MEDISENDRDVQLELLISETNDLKREMVNLRERLNNKLFVLLKKKTYACTRGEGQGQEKRMPETEEDLIPVTIFTCLRKMAGSLNTTMDAAMDHKCACARARAKASSSFNWLLISTILKSLTPTPQEQQKQQELQLSLVLSESEDDVQFYQLFV